MPYAYFYGRVSHRDSANKKLDPSSDTCQSVDHQLALARQRIEYDRASGKLPAGTVWGVTGWVGRQSVGNSTTDGCYIDQEVSAFRQKWRERPAGRRLHGKLQRGDSLYIAFLDRGFRNWKDFAFMLEHWQANGIRVVFIQPEMDLSTWTGEMLAAVLSLLGWLVSKLKSEDIKERFAAKRNAGRPVSRFPQMGFKHVGPNRKALRVVPDDEVREMRLRIISLHCDEGLTFKEISDVLEAEQAKAENREPIPDLHYKGSDRKWSRHRVLNLYRCIQCPLPSRLIEPGTLDRPSTTEERKGMRKLWMKQAAHFERLHTAARRRRGLKLNRPGPTTPLGQLVLESLKLKTA